MTQDQLDFLCRVADAADNHTAYDVSGESLALMGTLAGLGMIIRFECSNTHGARHMVCILSDDGIKAVHYRKPAVMLAQMLRLT